MDEIPLGRDASRTNIKKGADALLGQTLGDISADLEGLAGARRVKSKHGAADVIEQGFFDIEKNSSKQPDFEATGIELKVTPLTQTGDGSLLRPKERLKICKADYWHIDDAEHWRKVPELDRKFDEMLIIWYDHLEGAGRTEYPLVWYAFWEPDDDWSRRLNADFEILNEKVQEGKSPSEKHTEVLGTCPNHSGGYVKENPSESDPKSIDTNGHPELEYPEIRSWSIRSAGMLEILSETTGLPIVSRNGATGIEYDALIRKAEEESSDVDLDRFRTNYRLDDF